jgi:hypothetical protein
MRTTSRIASLVLAGVLALLPAVASAQPVWPPRGEATLPHRPGPGPGGPGGPGYHRPPPPNYGGHRPRDDYRRGGYDRHGRHYYRGDGYDPGAAAAAGIIGLAAGAIAAGAMADAQRSGNSHVRRCLRAYRSYDPDTDTFIDKYGRERRCRL